jgi:hypothetical protein
MTTLISRIINAFILEFEQPDETEVIARELKQQLARRRDSSEWQFNNTEGFKCDYNFSIILGLEEGKYKVRVYNTNMLTIERPLVPLSQVIYYTVTRDLYSYLKYNHTNGINENSKNLTVRLTNSLKNSLNLRKD